MYRSLAVSLLALSAVAAAGTTASARGDEVEALRRERDELRREKNQLQDQAIQLARRHDEDKRRLMTEKEALQRRNAELERDLARAQAAAGGGGDERPAGGAAPSPLDQEVTLCFDARRPADCAALIASAAGVEVDAARLAADAVVHLRAGRMPLRRVLDLLVLNVRDARGKLIDGLRWREAAGGVVLEPGR